MHQMLYLAIGWGLGLVLCVVLARTIIVRYRLPWRAALMYFGLARYPDETRLGLGPSRALPPDESGTMRGPPPGGGLSLDGSG